MMMKTFSFRLISSNIFHGGAISGGIGEAGLRAEGPGACNDNKARKFNDHSFLCSMQIILRKKILC